MAVQIAASGFVDYGSAVMTAPNGNIYVAVQSSGYIYVFKSTSGSSFSQVATAMHNTVFGVAAGGTYRASFAMDTNGYIHVAAISSLSGATRKLAYCLFDTSNDTFGTWEQAIALAQAGSGYTSCSIAIDSNNKPHILYIDYYTSMGNTISRTHYTNKTGANWLSAEQVSTSTSVSSTNPTIIVRASDIVEAHYEMAGSTAISRTRTSGTWGSETSYSPNANYVHNSHSLTATSGSSVYHYALKSSPATVWENTTQVGSITSFADTSHRTISAAISGTTRYLFYIDSSYNLYYVNSSGSGWTSPTLLENPTANISSVEAEWAYNGEYQSSRINYIFNTGGIYFNYLALAGPDQTISSVTPIDSAENFPSPIVVVVDAPIVPDPVTVGFDTVNPTVASSHIWTPQAVTFGMDTFLPGKHPNVGWIKLFNNYSPSVTLTPEAVRIGFDTVGPFVALGSVIVSPAIASFGLRTIDPIVLGMFAGILKRWDGGTWVREPLKVYLSSTWQSKPLKVYLDGQWKDVDITG